MLGLVKKIQIGICGDAGASARALLALLNKQPLVCDDNKQQRSDTIASEKAAWEKELDEWTHERDDYSMPADVMVSTDIGNINSVANSYLRFEKPRSFFAAMSFGNCGYAFPTIIGAKLAAPDRPAISYAGDGAWAMSMSEVLTCVRHDIPVTAVVFRNRHWGAEKKNQVDFYGQRFVGGDLDNNESFAVMARSMGAEGVVVSELSQIGTASKKLLIAK